MMAAGEIAELAQVRVVNWGSPSTKSQSAGLAGCSAAAFLLLMQS